MMIRKCFIRCNNKKGIIHEWELCWVLPQLRLIWSLPSLIIPDGVDSLHNCVDFGIQKGKQHRNRDIVAWVKKKRRNIRREDLLAFLCGKNPPARNRHSSSMVRHSQSSRLSVERTHSPRLQGPESLSSGTEPDLQAFREAIALQGIVILSLEALNYM